jgi:hypothetical protein
MDLFEYCISIPDAGAIFGLSARKVHVLSSLSNVFNEKTAR